MIRSGSYHVAPDMSYRIVDYCSSIRPFGLHKILFIFSFHFTTFHRIYYVIYALSEGFRINIT